MHFYDLCITPESSECNFDYYEVKQLAFKNPVHKGESIEYNNIELEINHVLHESEKSRLFCTCDEKI